MSWMSRPLARSASFSACLSARVIPSAGAGSSAEPPPLIRRRRWSSSPSAATSSITATAAASPRSSGTGWALANDRMPPISAKFSSVVTMIPGASQPASRTACAMPTAALPTAITAVGRPSTRSMAARVTAAGLPARSAASKARRAACSQPAANVAISQPDPEADRRRQRRGRWRPPSAPSPRASRASPIPDAAAAPCSAPQGSPD